jgi:hypothetical protein
VHFYQTALSHHLMLGKDIVLSISTVLFDVPEVDHIEERHKQESAIR